MVVIAYLLESILVSLFELTLKEKKGVTTSDWSKSLSHCFRGVTYLEGVIWHFIYYTY